MIHFENKVIFCAGMEETKFIGEYEFVAEAVSQRR